MTKYYIIYKTFFIGIILIFLPLNPLSAQKGMTTDSIKDNSYHFTYQKIIVPSILLGTGIVGSQNGWFKSLSRNLQNNDKNNMDDKLCIEDFTQYSQCAAVYGLNLCNIKGEHNFRDRTTLLATSYIIMAVCVEGLKKSTNIQRPDNSSFDSFPSGHTSISFMGATFLWKEYHEVSPWIGISGYAVATATGYLRLYNNRHWLTDILSGAGIGILSTNAAYWLYPTIEKILYKKKKSNVVALPHYKHKSVGVNLVLRF